MTEEHKAEKQPPVTLEQRLAQLAADKKRILAMPSEKAMDEIIDHPQGTALVHSMAEEDFFFLMHDVGPEDAMELLAMATNRQWEYILDLEIWNRDQISNGAVTHWLNLLLQAAPARFTKWAMTEKSELIEYYLDSAIEVIVREDDVDPGDLPEGFFSFDSVFYVRIRDSFLNAVEDEETRDQREHFIHDMLERLADEDYQGYQIMLLRAANVMPAESEEEAFRFRNMRLAEKGFLPFDEAMGVYAPMRPETIRKRPKNAFKTDDMDFTIPVPLHHSSMMTADTPFSSALWAIGAEDVLNDIQIEFAALCNQIIAADQHPIREREALRHIVHKACAYLSLGLHRLAETKTPPEPVQSATIIKKHPLSDIFRTGYALVLELKQRALKWKRQSWFAKNHLAMSFWGERLVGYIGGLLLAKPKFFDNYATGQLYREFSSLEDVEKARSALEEAIAFDQALSRMDLQIKDLDAQHFVTHENLLLTLWAKTRLELPVDFKPIPLDLFRPFFASLWADAKPPRKIKDTATSDFLSWIAATTGVDEATLSENIDEGIERLFARVEEEYGEVAPENLDPRFVQMFILKKR